MDLIDLFTCNQTVSYSNIESSLSYRNYALRAVGYLIRASPRIYGMQLAGIHMTPDLVSLLASPANAVSDIYIQVKQYL